MLKVTKTLAVLTTVAALTLSGSPAAQADHIDPSGMTATASSSHSISIYPMESVINGAGLNVGSTGTTHAADWPNEIHHCDS